MNEIEIINNLASCTKKKLNEYHINYNYIEVDIVTLEVTVYIDKKNNTVSLENFIKVYPSIKITRKYVNL